MGRLLKGRLNRPWKKSLFRTLFPFERRMPDFALSTKSGKSKIAGFFLRIKNPQAYGNLFKPGARVLELHVHAVNRREMVELLDRLKQQIPNFRRAGLISGFVGDTPTPALINQFKKKSNATVLKTPWTKAQIERFWYLTNVFAHKYPFKNALKKFRRIVVAFD